MSNKIFYFRCYIVQSIALMGYLIAVGDFWGATACSLIALLSHTLCPKE